MPDNNSTEPLILTEWALNMSRRKLGLDEATHFLKQEFPVREIYEALSRAIEEKADKNLQEANILEPAAQERDAAVTAVKAGLRRRLGPTDGRNLYNLLESGKVISIERITAIKIAFGLQMTVEEAVFFLNRCGHDSFYLRDVKDVIYWHGLENNWDYETVNEMTVRFKDLDQSNEEPEINDTVRNNMITEHIFLEYGKQKDKKLLSTPEQLTDFVNRHRSFFGSFRRRAYERFMELLNDLKKFWNLDLAVDAEIRKEAEYHQNIEAMPFPGENINSPEGISSAGLSELIVIGIPALRRSQSNKDEFRKKILKQVYEHVPTRSAMSQIINRTTKRKNQRKS